MDTLNITLLRPGADGRAAANAFGAANYDESKANPYPDLPDPLLLNNGKKVKTAKLWWTASAARRSSNSSTGKSMGAFPRTRPR